MSTNKKPVTTGRAKSFTIDRGKWLQGKRISSDQKLASMLRDKHGNMCCLGFYSEACGAGRLTGKFLPNSLSGPDIEKLDKKLFTKIFGFMEPSTFCLETASVNDTKNISDAKREEYVTKRFAKIGVKVKFTGKYPYAK